MIEKFSASVQYNDLKGASAADRADVENASKWLTDNGHINEQEFILGISMSVGENHGEHRDPIYVNFLVSELQGYENIPALLESSTGPVEVRKISIQMNLTEFFALFKRFSVTLSTSGMLNDKEYSYQE